MFIFWLGISLKFHYQSFFCCHFILAQFINCNNLLSLLCSASVDGRFFIWNITEGPDEEDKPQILGKIVVAIQMLADGDSVHPRVCWHPHKQVIIQLHVCLLLKIPLFCTIFDCIVFL